MEEKEHSGSGRVECLICKRKETVNVDESGGAAMVRLRWFLVKIEIPVGEMGVLEYSGPLCPDCKARIGDSR